MPTLYLLGTKIDWIHPELLLILKQNFQTGSVANQARARKIIRQIEDRDH